MPSDLTDGNDFKTSGAGGKRGLRVKTKLNGSTLVSYYKLHGQLYTQLGQKVKDFLFKDVLQERFLSVSHEL